MRRNEFAIETQEEIEVFLKEMTYGFLGTTSKEGWPNITPLNYVYDKGNLYFHGSKIGQKMEDLRYQDKATFAIAKEYAIIPSYFSDPNFACPATSYFKSVIARGNIDLLEDLAEKAKVLSAFMQKLQPEGGYNPITTEDESYIPRLRSVAVVKFTVQELTAKFKFGQNLNEERRTHVTDQLVERGLPLDEETAALMRKYCPHHQ